MRPNATIYIKIYPAGERGRVLIVVESDGPAELTDTEIQTVLRQTVQGMEKGVIRPNG